MENLSSAGLISSSVLENHRTTGCGLPTRLVPQIRVMLLSCSVANESDIGSANSGPSEN